MPSFLPKQAPTGWLLILTLLVTAVMLYTLFTGSSMTERYAPLVDAAMEIKLEATIGHLWFEEIISGDRYIAIDEVFAHLDQAEWYARAMLEGGENSEGTFIPLQSPLLREKIEQTLAGLKAFRGVAQQRWTLRQQSGVGSAIDQQFDRIFAEFMLAADQVETALQKELAARLQNFRITQILLIIFVAGLGLFLALTLRRHERRHLRDLLALQDKEEGLRITLDSIGDAVIATNTLGKVTRMNPVAETLTGWRGQDALGKPLGEIFNLVDSLTDQPARSPADKVLQSGEMIALNKHSKLIARDGTEYQIADSAAPIRDSAGELNGVVLVFRDVTEDHAMREALRVSEQLQSDLLNNSPAVIYMKDLAGRYLFVNNKFSELFHISTEEIEGKSDHELFSVDWADRFQANDRTVARTGATLEFEERVPQDDGEHIYLSVKFPLRKTSGDIYAVCGVSTDITERKQVEVELSQLRNYLGNIIDSMPSMLIGVDTQGKVTQWNHQAEKLLKLSATEAVGAELGRLVPRLAEELPRVQKALETRQQQTDLKRSRQQDGEICYEDLTIYPLVSNGVEGAVIRIDDVTDRVRVEEMMIQSEKMLSVGGLAAGMAHEINNPLAGMMQAVSVMNNRLCRDLPANQQAADALGIDFAKIQAYMEKRDIPHMMNALNESGHRVAGIVSNMLSFARKSDQASSSHDLDELIDKTLQLAETDYDLKKQYDFRNIRIERDYAKNLPLVPCEGAKIQQVLLNILRNGAQAMQEAGTPAPRFRISSQFEEEDNMVRIEIEDNGPGIAPEIKKRIFEPFFTTKAIGLGTGLGLSVSYFIITENHAGGLNVESSPGEGSKFIIRLPTAGRSKQTA